MKAPAQIPNNMKEKKLTSNELLLDSDGNPLTELTFADIDKTTFDSASRITLELIKCKQALGRAISRISYLNVEGIIGDEELVKEIIRESNSIDADINLLIANQMSYSLENSDYKEI